MVTVMPFRGTMPTIISCMASMARSFPSGIPCCDAAGLIDATSNSGGGVFWPEAAAAHSMRAAAQIRKEWRMAIKLAHAETECDDPIRRALYLRKLPMKRTFAVLAGVLAANASFAFAPTYDAKLFAELRWRSIGPLRAGRTKSAQGVAAQPNVFYIGVCNGGIWKTTDYGRTWNPIFDDQPTGSIGAVAIAPSDPNVIYAGSGEGLRRPDL